MTAWEIKWCNCLERCRALLDVADLREDTKDYVESVHLAINAYPLKYPTDKQAYWIHTLYRSIAGSVLATRKDCWSCKGLGGKGSLQDYSLRLWQTSNSNAPTAT